jgi:hypothetical protein
LTYRRIAAQSPWFQAATNAAMEGSGLSDRLPHAVIVDAKTASPTPATRARNALGLPLRRTTHSPIRFRGADRGQIRPRDEVDSNRRWMTAPADAP